MASAKMQIFAKILLNSKHPRRCGEAALAEKSPISGEADVLRTALRYILTPGNSIGCEWAEAKNGKSRSLAPLSPGTRYPGNFQD